MASYRKLPSGKWQATVRRPDGKRVTSTDPLKKVVKQWASNEEAKYARGDIRDPRAGHITVGAWYERWIAARGVEAVTKEKLRSAWRAHCELQWAKWPMESVTRMEAQEWATALTLKRRTKHRGRMVDDSTVDVPTIGAGTVRGAVALMTSLFAAATRERPPIILTNPFAGLDLPTMPPSVVQFFTHEEVDELVKALALLRPDQPQWPVLVQMGMWVGLRPGELFGLHGHRVDWLRKTVQITEVMTRFGIREHPKSKKSNRTVPVPAWLLADASKLLVGRDRESLLFTMPRGGIIRDADFRNAIWYPAIKAAGLKSLPPRAMRHTAASWLVQDGVPLYDVQALLGHESYTTTQRYAHLRPDAHQKVTESWSRRTSDARGAV